MREREDKGQQAGTQTRLMARASSQLCVVKCCFECQEVGLSEVNVSRRKIQILLSVQGSKILSRALQLKLRIKAAR